MKAMVLENPAAIEEQPLREREHPLPEPQDHEIRLRVTACGLCHTDLHTIEGELALPKLPLVPGHQIVGYVEALGRGADRFREGDRVGVPWLAKTCGTCEFCAGGRENLCEQARFTGFHVDGGYATYTVVAQDFAYLLPPSFSDVLAAPLLCAGVIGYRALRLSDIRSGQTLGLYGFGGSAHIAIQVAKYWGCEIYVFTRSEKHRALARDLGASWIGGAAEDPPSPIHSAIIFAPAGALVLEALRVLRRGGVLALAGIYMTPVPPLEYPSIYHEKTIRSVANSTREDAIELLELAGEIPIRTEVESFPLEDANQALLRLKQSRLRGAGVLVLSQ